ncbi:pentatricopeptide repeat-containing protein 1, mitochondrial [Chelonus insularis]|uniref:pentatricopeptide repeat-containing protein 1, mitochondrial n=1 Tax=Chelonus insularis TaxID=460826 RepID=UPI00158A61DB|nr:pentatricopeptide repeat-containing protein 1, mitochondrial [Chelonus insularis]
MLSIRFLIIRYNNRVKKIGNLQKHANFSFSTCTLIHRPQTINYNSLNLKSCVSNYINHVIRPFSSEQLVEPVDPDVFGNLSGERYQREELDDDEKKVEEFEKNEVRIPRRFKLSKGQYERLVKKHITEGNLDAAMEVLDLIKRNRDKPTTYLFNLLMRAFARQGDLSTTHKLYTIIKKRDYLKPNAATYTNMINACANSRYREAAIEILASLRQEFLEKDILLNETHYNAMIKAYGVHKRILEAFEFADVMIDKKMTLKESTFSSLMYAANSDEKNGLRHVLVVWHKMQAWRIKPTLNTYKLILRAIRQTQLGDLKLNDLLNEKDEQSRIIINNGKETDLLAYPPVVSSLLIESLQSIKSEEHKNDILSIDSGKNENAPILISTSPTELIEKKLPEEPKSLALQPIYSKNRLAFFGGYKGFLNRMMKSGITPDVSSLTLLMEISPNSLTIEKEIIQHARKLQINLDIDFFNMLIKKRCLRKDYKNAKSVLDDIQHHRLTPNIMTWGVLALTCSTLEDARALIQNMRTTGHLVNSVIIGALIGNASCTNDFDYIHEMMDKIVRYKIRPSKELYEILDKFQHKITDIVTERIPSKHSKNPRYQAQLAKFNRKYAIIQEINDRDVKTARQ